MADSAAQQPAPSPSRDWYWLGVGFLALLYLGLALVYITRLPAMSGPDEEAHLRYVQVLHDHWRMPVLPRLVSAGQEGLAAEQAQHPPLYYAVLAVVSYALPPLEQPLTQKLLKLVSVLMGLGALGATALLARRLWPRTPVLALAAVGFVALVPNTAYMTSLINNSAGSILASAVALLLLERALRDEAPDWRRWLAVGVVIGLGMLAKITAVWLVPAAGVGLLWQVRWRQAGRRECSGSAVGLLAPVLALIGPWFLRNFLTFGELMPERVLGRRFLPDGFLTVFFAPLASGLLVRVTFVYTPLSLLGPFWLLRTEQRPVLPMVFVAALTALTLTGLLLRRRAARNTARVPGPVAGLLGACAVGILVAWFVCVQALLHDWNTGLYAGRYALETLPALGLLWAAGVPGLSRSPRVQGLIVATVLLIVLISNLYVCQFVITFFHHAAI